MPYLQLDVPARYSIAAKRAAAKRMGEVYAEVMQTTPDLVHVCFRELDEGGLWHCSAGEPQPAAVLMCEVRRGRAPEQRARLGDALIKICADAFGLDETQISVEFTQHAGDEIYRTVLVDGVLRGGLGKDWTAKETGTPLMAVLAAETAARG